MDVGVDELKEGIKDTRPDIELGERLKEEMHVSNACADGSIISRAIMIWDFGDRLLTEVSEDSPCRVMDIRTEASLEEGNELHVRLEDVAVMHCTEKANAREYRGGVAEGRGGAGREGASGLKDSREETSGDVEGVVFSENKDSLGGIEYASEGCQKFNVFLSVFVDHTREVVPVRVRVER